MEKSVPFLIDHFGVVTPDNKGATSFLQTLGFVTGGGTPGAVESSESCHFMFDNCYLECDQLSETGTISPLRIEVKGGPGVYFFIMSTRDVDKSRAAFIEAGFSPSEISRGFSRSADHGKIKGEAVFNAFYLNPVDSFSSMFVGAVCHVTKELIYQKGRYVHENGVNKVSSLVLYYETPEKLEAAEKDISKLEGALRATADPVCHMGNVRLVDKSAYESEFGVSVPTIKSVVAAAQFEDADLAFLRKKAASMGVPHFDKDGKLYIDARKETGLFLIFE